MSTPVSAAPSPLLVTSLAVAAGVSSGVSSRGGEAPIAREPQPEAEAEETPDDTPAATAKEVTNKGDGAAETGVDTNYVADIIAAQSTWDPWPTPA